MIRVNIEKGYRDWTAGLLIRLDKQRQRILESYFMEQNIIGSRGPGRKRTQEDIIRAENLYLNGAYERERSSDREC